MIFGHDGFRLLPQYGSEVHQLVNGSAVTAIGWWFRGKRLSRRIPFTWNVALFHRPFLDRPHRLSRDSIENIQKALFGRLGDGLDRPAFHRDISKNRGGRDVHVPQWVMHELEMPFPLPGFQIDAYQRFTKELIAGPMPA